MNHPLISTPPPLAPPLGGYTPAALQPAYAVELTLTPGPVSRWAPIVHFFKAIPHFFVAWWYGLVAFVCAIVAWFAIMLTGKLPEGLAANVMRAIRFQTRTITYVYFLHAQRPPCAVVATAADPGDQPARVDFVPEYTERNRLSVVLRLIFAIPAIVLNGIVMLVAGICLFIGLFVVIFTGKWADGVQKWVVKGATAQTRLCGYLFLLTDKAPPNPFN